MRTIVSFFICQIPKSTHAKKCEYFDFFIFNSISHAKSRATLLRRLMTREKNVNNMRLDVHINTPCYSRWSAMRSTLHAQRIIMPVIYTVSCMIVLLVHRTHHKIQWHAILFCHFYDTHNATSSK